MLDQGLSAHYNNALMGRLFAKQELTPYRITYYAT
jgi:hypothetical protein